MLLSYALKEKNFAEVRVAIVADWLTSIGGAEEVVKSFCRVFPQADLFAPVVHSRAEKIFAGRNLSTSFLQKFPAKIRSRHQVLLPFFPHAIESFDFSKYDMVISSSSFIAKGIITKPTTLHICYCHTPTRYLWEGWQEYLQQFPFPRGLGWTRIFLKPFLSRLRVWDRFAADRPDIYIANSEFIAEQIAHYYKRKSTVLTPPVRYEKFSKGKKEEKDNFFLALGRLTPYKKFDLLIRAFKNMPSERLKIGGDGPDLIRLQKLAAGVTNIKFLGFIPQQDIVSLMGMAKGLLFPQIEDAGIVAMEALAAGTPVIAFAKGGIRTVVSHKRNGVFFFEQTPQSLQKAVEVVLSIEWNREKISDSIKSFSREAFEENFLGICREEWEKFKTA